MPSIVVPSGRLFQAMQSSCRESFYFDYDSSGTLLLMLRLFPALAASVANGAPLSLTFANPHTSPHEVTLSIQDVSDAPSMISRKFATETGDPVSADPPGLSAYVDYFSKGQPLCVAIFDPLLRCVYASDTTFTVPVKSVKEWHQNLTIPKAGSPEPADSKSHYRIDLAALEPPGGSTTPWLIDLEAQLNWGDQPYTTGLKRTSREFKITDYLREGVVGRWQEQTLRELLTTHFNPGTQLFFNPELPDKHELTDVAVTVPGVVVLVESKCPASFEGGKPRLRSKRRTTTTRAIKACEQLRTADAIVRTASERILDAALAKQCGEARDAIQVCVLSDPALLIARRLNAHLADHTKDTWPIIMSPSTLLQLIAFANRDEDFVFQLIRAREAIRAYDGLPIFEGLAHG